MRNIFCSSWHRKPKLTPHSAVSWRNGVSWTLRFPNFARRCASIPNMLRPTTIWVLRSLSWITAWMKHWWNFAKRFASIPKTPKPTTRWGSRFSSRAAWMRRCVNIAKYYASIQYAEAHYKLGNALDDQGRPEAAAAEYREALRITL